MWLFSWIVPLNPLKNLRFNCRKGVLCIKWLRESFGMKTNLIGTRNVFALFLSLWAHDYFKYPVDHFTQLRKLVLCNESWKGKTAYHRTHSIVRSHLRRLCKDVSLEHWVVDFPHSMYEGIWRDDLSHIFPFRNYSSIQRTKITMNRIIDQRIDKFVNTEWILDDNTWIDEFGLRVAICRWKYYDLFITSMNTSRGVPVWKEIFLSEVVIIFIFHSSKEDIILL